MRVRKRWRYWGTCAEVELGGKDLPGTRGFKGAIISLLSFEHELRKLTIMPVIGSPTYSSSEEVRWNVAPDMAMFSASTFAGQHTSHSGGRSTYSPLLAK